jgi:hypothetical protein
MEKEITNMPVSSESEKFDRREFAKGALASVAVAPTWPGVLRGRKATTHWAAFKLLNYFGAIPVDACVVIDQDIVSAAGITSGIDGALTLAALLRGDTVAQEIQLDIQYAPEPPFHAGDPKTARQEVLNAVTAKYQSLTDARERTARRIRDRLRNVNIDARMPQSDRRPAVGRLRVADGVDQVRFNRALRVDSGPLNTCPLPARSTRWRSLPPRGLNPVRSRYWASQLDLYLAALGLRLLIEIEGMTTQDFPFFCCNFALTQA